MPKIVKNFPKVIHIVKYLPKRAKNFPILLRERATIWPSTNKIVLNFANINLKHLPLFLAGPKAQLYTLVMSLTH